MKVETINAKKLHSKKNLELLNDHSEKNLFECGQDIYVFVVVVIVVEVVASVGLKY